MIGSLGVLDDVTVTQVSAVGELRRLQPAATVPELYRAAVAIGRDHISSTVNTLVLAYAGAALPLLLLFTEVGNSIADVATRRAGRGGDCAHLGRLDRPGGFSTHFDGAGGNCAHARGRW